MDIETLLKGVVDPHVHASPSSAKRSVDLLELCQRAEKAGYKGVAHKDHNLATGALTQFVKTKFFSHSPLEIIGTIALNNTVGGLDPCVLETAIQFGARIVWLPTSSAKNHREFMKKLTGRFPQSSLTSVSEDQPVVMTDETGGLTKEMKTVFEVLAAYPKVAVCSGHGSPSEIDAMIDECAHLGILDRFFVDHPTEIIAAPDEQIIAWAQRGATIEFVAANSLPANDDLSYARLARLIKRAAPEKVILASDYGMVSLGDPIEGFGKFLLGVYEQGFGLGELRAMSSDNISRMLGI